MTPTPASAKRRSDADDDPDVDAPARAVEIVRWNDGNAMSAIDRVAVEEPLAIRVRGRPISVTMRTPGHDAELAVGFLLSEGVIARAADVLRAEHCAGDDANNTINVLLAAEVYVDFDRLTRHVFASSSCGLCGKTTIDATRGDRPPIAGEFSVAAQAIARMPDAMRDAQATFDQTGGLHAAALFDAGGGLIVLREDVGRHNAVDKVIGHCVVRGIAPDRHVLLVSGRSSFEILQKAASAGIAIVAAVSAPSSLAVAFAESSGQTLIGFLRGARMNVYSHAHRIVAGARDG